MSSLSRIDRAGDSNWVYNVKRLLCSSGFGDVWYSQGTTNPTRFYQIFKHRQIDMFRQEWSYRLSESTRARFFSVIVPRHGFCDFLDKVNVKSHRIALTRLIASSHNLRVETGRWESPIKLALPERLCEKKTVTSLVMNTISYSNVIYLWTLEILLFLDYTG